MRLNFKYLGWALVIFVAEVYIALFVQDHFIRPYIGDVLVVILIYTIIKGLTSKPTKKLPYYIFAFAVIVELTQLLNLVGLLGLSDNKIAATILGTSFDIKDILMYGIGCLLLIEWERLLRKDISYL